MRRLVLIAATLVVAALSVAATHAGADHPDEVLGGGAAGALVLQVVAGMAAWCAGLYMALRLGARLAGALLAAAGVSVFLTALAAPVEGSSAVFTAALVGGGLAPTLGGAATAAFVRRPVLAAVSVTVVAVPAGLVPALTFSPRGSGCFRCPANQLLVHADLALYDDAVRWGLRAVVVTGVLLGITSIVTWWRSGALRLTAGTLVAGAPLALLGAISAGHTLDTPGIDPAARGLWMAECALVLAFAAAIGARAWLAWRLRDRVAGLVLAALPDAARLRRMLADGVDDPLLELVFPREHGPAVNANGSMAGPAGAGQDTLLVRRADRVVAEVRHSRTRVAPERLAGAVRAAGLALDHGAGRARLRAELADLSASRMRIVEVGDAERRRLERDLHDGAQQRLIALTLALQSAHEQAAGDVEREALSAARYEVRQALGELRAIAHGIHPVSLTEAGLDAALRELVEDSPVPVRLDVEVSGRTDPRAEAAAYRAVADALGCACEPARVHVQRFADGALGVRIDVKGDRAAFAAALVNAGDRAVAHGGSLTVDDGVVIEMRVPCGS